MHELLSDCPVTAELIMRWGDMDAYGHLNNAVYFRYFEELRIRYMREAGFATRKDGNKNGLVVAKTSCKYRIPLVYPDTIYAGAKVTRVDDGKLVMIYKLVSKSHDKLAAQGEALLVGFDLETMEKSYLDEKVVKNIEALEEKKS
jgi:acyl-CoA thioester hydrolase